LFISGLANSFALDWLLRIRITVHLNFHYLKAVPLPRVHFGSSHFDVLVPHAARLICTTFEFADLWNEVAQHYPDTMAAPWQPDYTAIDPCERAQLRAEIDAMVADLYGLSEEDFAYILTTFPLLDRDMPPLPGEPKSFVTRDLALLALFKLRGKTPPADIVDFFAAAGADISAITGPLRDLEERVAEATRLGAVAYIPSGRGGEIEVEPEEAEVQLGLFKD
jgi:hypothetical protein